MTDAGPNNSKMNIAYYFLEAAESIHRGGFPETKSMLDQEDRFTFCIFGD